VARVVCVLYDDPAEGHPAKYARDGIPRVELYPDGQTTPSPIALDFTPGELLGDVTGGLGLHEFMATRGHLLIITADKDGPHSVFDRELPEAEVVISQPCWPAALNAERIAKAPKLKLVITAGVGSDHIDLSAAATHGITVAEITSSASVSAAEYAVMLILSLVHNAVPSSLPGARRDRNFGDYTRRGVRSRGDARTQCRCRPLGVRSLATIASLRCALALHRPAPSAIGSRDRVRSHLSSGHGLHGRGMRRGDDPLSTA
jgi:D-isomer specific 2-hydroxyacid dehydrogenase, catalytic domain